ncbi:insulinase family protein, partial [Salinimicrobium sp. CDJ15-91]|nr:insulinase family protein [Salinimicrobium oceani]
PNVTASKVFEDYIKAIGGKEAVEKVNSVYMIAQANFQGQKMDLESKVTSSGKSSTEVGMGGNVMSRQIFNGATGFVAAQGQKIPYTEEQIIAAKAEAHPFPEMIADNAALEGVEDVDGKEAYAIKMDENTTNYYSKKTGLKVKQVKTVQQGPQTVTVPTTFSDYREVEGVKFPFTINQSMGPMVISFEVSEIKVNEGVVDTDFE